MLVKLDGRALTADTIVFADDDDELALAPLLPPPFSAEKLEFAPAELELVASFCENELLVVVVVVLFRRVVLGDWGGS